VTDRSDYPGGTWQPMSPEQVRGARLREAGLARRGYHADDVHVLLNQIAAEIDRWMQRCAALQAEVLRLQNFYRDQGTDTSVHGPRQAALSVDAVQMLARAQAYADQVVADAQAQARNLQSDARASGEAILARARREAEQAAHAYGAHAGPAYRPDREETEHLTAWAHSILATVDSVQKQLAASSEAFAVELAKFTARPPGGAGADAPLTRHRGG
jgi:cell division septum initiation protein DivIVA